MSIRFLFRGEVIELADARPGRSVLQWLREDAVALGTKEGCNQGDCGACTVMVAAEHEGSLRLRTANACLMLLPMLDGCALFTVEDAADEDLHPIQQALVDHAGSQCGFCTPGFVMSLWCAEENGGCATRAEAASAITGNLCRCTGYRPILDAAEAARSSGPALDREALLADLRELGAHDLQLTSSFLRPRSIAEVAYALRAHPDATVVAGGTDLVVAWRASGAILRDVATLVSLAGVPELTTIEHADSGWSIGAAIALEDVWALLVYQAPSLARMAERFASPAIRARGTIGGNIANASPVADLVPVLIALDTVLVLTDSDGSRSVPLEEFATGARATVLGVGEFVERIEMPAAAFTRDVRAHKVSRRFDDDISSVSLVAALKLDGETVTDARVVLGGMAATVRRARGVEDALRGGPWDAAALRAAQDALAAEFTPLTDHRASARYRSAAASGLLERWWRETSPHADGSPLDVWGAR